VEDLWKVVGTVCRYFLAALACWWLLRFFALIGQQAEQSQELAGMAFGKAIICGAVSATWFYRARKAQQMQKLADHRPKATHSAAPSQPNASIPPTLTAETRVNLDADQPPGSYTPEFEQSKREEKPMPVAGWLFIGVVCVSFVVVLVVVVNKAGEARPTNPIDEAFKTQTGQNQVPASPGQKPLDLSDVFGPKAKDAVASACPQSLPSGVGSKPLPRNDLPNLVGWEGSLYSWEEYDDNARPFLKWKALFGYKNNTNSCITSAIVEVDLDHNGTVSKEQHSVVFDPILGLQESRAVDARLKIRTPEGSEDVALTGWRIVGVSGFPSGPPHANDANGFEIVKDPNDPLAAYALHEIRPTSPRSGTPTKVKIPADVAEGLLLQKTQPIYPPIARAARVSGTVVLQATISRAGAVEELRVVNGPQLLQQATLDAVKTWRYKPYKVGNEPVEVETTVNVVFALGR
jgi:TonB family protein